MVGMHESKSASRWLPLSCLLVMSIPASAQVPHLDDAHYEPFRAMIAPLDRHKFPRVGLTETKSLPPTAEAISKYDTVLVNVPQMSNALITAQRINPDLLVFRKYNAGGYQGYDLRDPCRDPLGVPFGSAGAATANCQFFAGHWAYYAGTTTNQSMSAGAVSVTVGNGSRLTAGGYAVIYDAPAGSFRNAEHVLVQAVNGNTITFARRGYKSTARAHPTGSIIAEHPVAAGGRYGASARHWRYNLSSASPRDANGRQIGDVMAAWLRDNFNVNGQGQVVDIRIDGIIFDTDSWSVAWEDRLDVDNDLIPDGGWNWTTGANYWGEGSERFYQLVRGHFPDKLLVGGDRHVRGFESLNGTQMEGWPVSGLYHSASPAYERTDEVLANSVLHLREGPPQMASFVENFSKTPTRLFTYGVSPRPSSNAPFRFAFGLSLLDNGYYAQESNSSVPDPWWDEFAVDVAPGSPTFGDAIASNRNDESRTRIHRGWLGLPLGGRERIYDSALFAVNRSLIPNGGLNASSQLTGWRGSNVSLSFDSSDRMSGAGSMRVSRHINYGASPPQASVRAPTVSLRAGVEYTLAFSIKSEETRSINVTVGGQVQSFMIPDYWVRRVMTFTADSTSNSAVVFQVGRESVPFLLDEVYLFEGNANVFKREFEHGLVVVNATGRTRTIPLGDTYLKIRGTGQDDVNDGSRVTSVTLPANDAVILVKPVGSPPTPPPGATCGEPVFSAAGETAVFIWNACDDPQNWSVRFTAGGRPVSYQGVLSTDRNFLSLAGVSQEASDNLTPAPFSSPTTGPIRYIQNVGATGFDGFDVRVPSGAVLCFGPTLGEEWPVFVGQNRREVSAPVNLSTLSACTP